MIKKLLVISLFTLSCFAANPGKTTKLDTRPTLNLNKSVGPIIAQQFAHHKVRSGSVGLDLTLRTLGSFGIGFITLPFCLCAGMASDAGPLRMADRFIISGIAIGIPVALCCSIFYPGNTYYDKGTPDNQVLITVARGVCTVAGFFLGATSLFLAPF